MLESKIAIVRLHIIHDNDNFAESSLQETKQCIIKVEMTDKLFLRTNHSSLCSVLISHKASTGK